VQRYNRWKRVSETLRSVLSLRISNDHIRKLHSTLWSTKDSRTLRSAMEDAVDYDLTDPELLTNPIKRESFKQRLIYQIRSEIQVDCSPALPSLLDTGSRCCQRSALIPILSCVHLLALLMLRSRNRPLLRAL
jgi:hypothetical protein